MRRVFPKFIVPTAEQIAEAKDAIGLIPGTFPRCLPLTLYGLLKFVNSKDGRCYPAQATLADATGQSESAVRKGLKLGEKLRLISELSPGKGTWSACWQFNWDKLSLLTVFWETYFLRGEMGRNILGYLDRTSVRPDDNLDRTDVQLDRTPVQLDRTPVQLDRTNHNLDRTPVTPNSPLYNSPLGTLPSNSPLRDSELRSTPSKKKKGLQQKEADLALSPFERKWISPEGIEAAKAAEAKTPGSGRAVAAKFANEAWKQSRKGKAAKQ